MVEDIVFGRTEIQIILDNIEIFQYEFPGVRGRDWKNFISKKGGCSCTQNIIQKLKENPIKTNEIFSQLLDKKINLYFPGPIDNPIVKEFSTLSDMEVFLKTLKNQGKHIKSATPAPDGKGGYILVVI